MLTRTIDSSRMKTMAPRWFIMARTTSRTYGGQPIVAETRSKRLRTSGGDAMAAAATATMMPSWIGSQTEVIWVRSVVRSPLFKAARAVCRSLKSISGSPSRRTRNRRFAPRRHAVRRDLLLLRQAEAEQNDGKTEELRDARHVPSPT